MRVFCLFVVVSSLSFIYVGASKADDFSATEDFTVAALGDSITAGFNADGIFDNRELSWSTGTARGRILSHFLRLNSFLDRPLRSVNLSVSGATVQDVLEKQIPELHEVDTHYVTMLVGANDICGWTSRYEEHLQTFADKYSASVDAILEKGQDTKVLILPVPNMLQLYEVGRANGCQIIWDSLGICKPLLASGRTAAERASFGQRLASLNEILEGIAAEHPNQIKYATSIATTSFEWKDVSSLDCFHPSLKGQNKIAELSWNEGWYAGQDLN